VKQTAVSSFGRDLDTAIREHNNLFTPIVAIGKSK
jgi:hypothetical protein